MIYFGLAMNNEQVTSQYPGLDVIKKVDIII